MKFHIFRSAVLVYILHLADTSCIFISNLGTNSNSERQCMCLFHKKKCFLISTKQLLKYVLLLGLEAYLCYSLSKELFNFFFRLPSNTGLMNEYINVDWIQIHTRKNILQRFNAFGVYEKVFADLD